MEKDGPPDEKKTKNNQDSQMGLVTTKKIFEKIPNETISNKK